MKRLKKNQLGPWCSFCPPKTTRAVFVQHGWHGKFCCGQHKKELIDCEKDNYKLTEADYQTWFNL